MTFFANSGATFPPDLAPATIDAGIKSLRAASELWALIAILEGDTSSFTLEKVDSVAKDFYEAAGKYKRVVELVDDRPLEPLSSAEIELAAVGQQGRYFLRYEFEYRPYSSLKRMYTEMVVRLETLASRVSTLNFSTSKEAGAPQVFQLMHDWDALSSLGRVIAVVNRRERRGLGEA